MDAVMSFDRARFRSDTFKWGEPKSHARAVGRVFDFISENRRAVYPDPFDLLAPFRVWFPPQYVQEKAIKWDRYEYDLGCVTGYLQEPILIVEIGGPGDDSRHQPGNTAQLIKDGIAREYIERYHPKCRFVRINKDDCAYSEELRKRLFL